MEYLACHQRTSHCQNCPFWKQSNPDYGFSPEALQGTVVDHLEKGLIHPCHSNKKYMCTGYLSFAEQTFDDGILSLNSGRVAARLGLLDPEKIPKIEVYSCIAEMLEEHGMRTLMTKS